MPVSMMPSRSSSTTTSRDTGPDLIAGPGVFRASRPGQRLLVVARSVISRSVVTRWVAARAYASAAALALASMSLLAPANAEAADVVSVSRLDITRYAGEWHEIARLPMFFQRNCVRNITARYTLREDGMVGVHNRCEDRDGEVDEVEGVARRVPGREGELEVRFAPDWLSWLPLSWADYWVIALDAEYQWAVVGDPDREHLWILSRIPEMSRERLDDLKARATAMGYDLSPLIVSAPIR